MICWICSPTIRLYNCGNSCKPSMLRSSLSINLRFKWIRSLSAWQAWQSTQIPDGCEDGAAISSPDSGPEITLDTYTPGDSPMPTMPSNDWLLKSTAENFARQCGLHMITIHHIAVWDSSSAWIVFHNQFAIATSFRQDLSEAMTILILLLSGALNALSWQWSWQLNSCI